MIFRSTVFALTLFDNFVPKFWWSRTDIGPTCPFWVEQVALLFIDIMPAARVTEALILWKKLKMTLWTTHQQILHKNKHVYAIYIDKCLWMIENPSIMPLILLWWQIKLNIIAERTKSAGKKTKINTIADVKKINKIVIYDPPKRGGGG